MPIKPNHSIAHLSLGRKRVRKAGIEEIRELLGEAEATAGLAVTPLLPRRSKLYDQLFSSDHNSVGLVASIESPYAPTTVEAFKRYRHRRKELARSKRLGRLAGGLAQRALMPPASKSLPDMVALSQVIDTPHLFGNIYPEELPPDKALTNNDVPFTRSTQISPDTVEKLGITTKNWPAILVIRGFEAFSFNPYHAIRRSQTGKTQLASWETYLPKLAGDNLIRQLVIPLNRGQDLPPQTDADALAEANRIAEELVKEDVNISDLGQLPEQVACIARQTPGTPIDFTLSGNLAGFRPQELATVFHNLDALASAA